MLARLPLVLAFCGMTAAAWAQPSRHNVLIFLADDVGVDKIGAYGLNPNAPPTPNIDALATRGVTFDQAWAYPLCSPTRACIMTGRWGFRTGVGAPLVIGGTRTPLSLSEITIPEQLDLQRSGYSHGAFGKWHLSNEATGGPRGPNLAGWSYFAGVLFGVGNYYRWPRVVNGVTATSTVYNTTATVDDALAWINSVPEPWVCYVAFQTAHTPYHAPPANLHTQNLSGLNVTETPLPFFRAMVQSMDTEMGRMLGALGNRVNNTDIVFLADNGTPANVIETPYTGPKSKGTPYEGGVRVPLIVAGPSVVGPGRRIPHLVATVDLFATVMEIAGVDPNPPVLACDSASLVPLLANPSQGPVRSFALSEQFSGPAATAPAILALRDQRYKLIRWTWIPQDEFYDLEKDPYENNNLLAGTLSGEQQLAYNNLVRLLAVRNPTAAIATFGNATCAGSRGMPAISGTGEPRLGASISVGLDNGPSLQLAVLTIGGSRTSLIGGIPLPISLATFGGQPGCFLWNSLEDLLTLFTDPRGRVAIPLRLPVDPVLVGGSLYFSWLCYDPGFASGPLSLTSSDGLVVTIGN